MWSKMRIFFRTRKISLGKKNTKKPQRTAKKNANIAKIDKKAPHFHPPISRRRNKHQKVHWCSPKGNHDATLIPSNSEKELANLVQPWDAALHHFTHGDGLANGPTHGTDDDLLLCLLPLWIGRQRSPTHKPGCDNAGSNRLGCTSALRTFRA